MGTIKQINIKNRTYYFYNVMIDIKTFDPDLLKIDKKSYKDIGIYNIGYTTIKKIDDYENIYSVNPLCLTITHAIGYIEEKGINKYLIFDSMDENKVLLKKYDDAFNGIRNKIKNIGGNECDYEEDYMKIRFNSNDNLPLKKQLKLHNMIITIRSVFEEDGKLYPQVFLDDTLYELNVQKRLNMKELIFQKGLMLIKQIYQKSVIFVTIGILKKSVLNMNLIFVMHVMI